MGFLSSNLTYLQVWASCLNDLTVAKIAVCIVLEEVSEIHELKHPLYGSVSLSIDWRENPDNQPVLDMWLSDGWMRGHMSHQNGQGTEEIVIGAKIAK